MEIISPANQTVYQKLALQSKEQVLEIVEQSKVAQKSWKRTSVEERKRLVSLFVDHLLQNREDIASELSHLIGRPRKQNYNELKGFETRARYLISIATETLQDYVVEESEELHRFIKKEPLGVILIISAWNYPYLVSVNGIVPALLSGNTVILKQAPQTFPVSHRFMNAIQKAGFPPHVFQVLQADHDTAKHVITHPDVNYIHFTGSVQGGAAVNQLAQQRFIGVGLELGGKDPAYVRADADIAYAAEQLVDGAMYNSGQSCCAIERIYVHESVFDSFVEHAVKTAKGYVLGDPFDPATNLGPVVSVQQANRIREQIKDAIGKGAIPLLDPSLFPQAKEGTAFIAPQIFVNVNHQMKLMTEESFGPIVGILKVKSDQEAIDLMNDSEYGLTASVWTKDRAKGLEIGNQ